MRSLPLNSGSGVVHVLGSARFELGGAHSGQRRRLIAALLDAGKLVAFGIQLPRGRGALRGCRADNGAEVRALRLEILNLINIAAGGLIPDLYLPVLFGNAQPRRAGAAASVAIGPDVEVPASRKWAGGG